MFDRLKSLFAGGVRSKYAVMGSAHKNHTYVLHDARDRKTLRPVTIKEYSPEGVELERKLDRLFRKRPLAEILPTLASPFIAAMVEIEENDTKRIEVFEAVGGKTLREALSERELTGESLLKAMRDVAAGLSYLHSLGLVHRGLMPEVIRVTPEGDATITDLSYIMCEERARQSSTMAGVTSYSAPEVIRRAPVDRRSDIFSFGAILYEAVCGMPLFPNMTGFERLLRVMNSKPVSPRERSGKVSEELERIIMKAVATKPSERYASIEEMMSDLSNTPLPGGAGLHTPAFAA